MIGYTVNDTFSNLLSGLLPVLTAFFDLSYLLAGLVAMVFNLTPSILQPLLGRWFDRTQTTWLLEAGLALNYVGMSLAGIFRGFLQSIIPAFNLDFFVWALDRVQCPYDAPSRVR